MDCRLGFTGQISPWKPISTDRLIAIAAIVPPTKAMLRGEKSRASLCEWILNNHFPLLEKIHD